MHRHPYITRRPAFTLLEVLMALFLGGMVLTAASAFVFGLFTLTLETEEAPVFDTHVDSVAGFLGYAFASALPPASDAGDGDRIQWRARPGSRLLNEQALSFRLPGELPLFVGEGSFLPEVNCFLAYDPDEGLVFLWQTDAMATEDSEDLRQTVLSPLTVAMEFLYYDADTDRWDAMEEPDQEAGGGLRLPDFLRIEFKTDDGNERVVHVLLPTAANGDLVL